MSMVLRGLPVGLPVSSWVRGSLRWAEFGSEAALVLSRLDGVLQLPWNLCCVASGAAPVPAVIQRDRAGSVNMSLDCSDGTAREVREV